MKRLQKTAVLLTAVILAGAFSSEDIKVEATSSTWQQIQKEQEEKNNGLLHGDSDNITVEGHVGTWYAIDETEVGGEKFFLLEHEEHGDKAA